VSDKIKIDFGDGVSGLDRTMRAITLLLAEAVRTLEEQGWTRKTVNIEIDENDPLPCFVTLKGKRVYEVGFQPDDAGRLIIAGNWIGEIPKPGIIEKFWGKV
jgi:hypothetical protein